MKEKPDPTKDKDFQKVVKVFLTTPPVPHTEASKKTKAKPKGKSLSARRQAADK